MHNPISTECEDSAQLTITVDRNLYPPEFSQQVYTTSIPETEDVGNVVLEVTVNDQDRIVSNSP